MLELKEKLLIKLKDFKSFITLTYPIEVYPKEEIRIKLHLKNFTDKLRKQSKKTTIKYFYVYELHENGNIHIHILTTINTEKQLLSLKKYWSSTIGTENQQCLILIKIDETILDQYCSYILKFIDNQNDRKLLLEKLGTNSRLFGGSLEFQQLLKELRGTLIEYPLTCEEPYKAQSLSSIVNKLKEEYPSNTVDEIETEINLELKNYNDAYTYIQYQNVEEFLQRGKSEISKGYLQFFNFIKSIRSKIEEDFLYFIENILKQKERKNNSIKMFIESLEYYKEENYRILIELSLNHIFKCSIRGVYLSYMCLQLGKTLLQETVIQKYYNISLKKEIGDIDYEEKLKKEYRRSGSLLINLLKYLLKKNLNLELNFTTIDKTNDINYESILENFDLEDTEKFILQDVQIVEIKFDFDKLETVKLNRKITKELITQNLQITHPMLIKPKDWDISNLEKLIENNIELFDTQKITNGGYLLNNFYFKTSLQKTKNSIHHHKLAISKKCIDTINKLQKVAFVVNKELLKLLLKYKTMIPDYKRNEKIKQLLLERKEKNQIKAKLYKEKKLLEIKNANIGPINEQIQKINGNIEEISSEITKNETLNRLLSGFSDLLDQKEFYYSYDLDFRMRIYPQQLELSPQGSKLSRSLILFKEEFEFNLYEFMIYSTRLFLKIYEFTEIDLILIFKAKVEPLLNEFINNEKEALIKIFNEVNEPYLFLSACIEYKNYIEAEKVGEKYYTGFPIILDCSGSGPQILSLLFLMEDFSKYLNLEPSEGRKDFYISVIEKFLQENAFMIKSIKTNLSGEDMKMLLILLRGCCKNIIMTQIYGVGFLKVNRVLNKALREKRSQLINYLNIDINYDEFTSEFIKSFWEYLRHLPLFKLRGFFQVIINQLSKADKELSWMVLSNSKVSVDYQKYKEERHDFKDNILGRTQIYNKLKIGKKNFSKMKTSAQANFIHSVDASVNMYILENHKSSIFPIHDAWGVGMGTSLKLQNSLKEIYYKLAEGNLVLQKLIDDFVKLLTETVSKEAGDSFRKYCETTIKIGKYDPNSLLLCKYMAYLG